MVKQSERLRTRTPLVGAIVVALVLAGCGGSKSKSTTTTSASHSATTPSTSASSQKSSGVASVTTGPVRGSLTGPNHAPTAGQGWPYSVKVMDAGGKPLSGMVDIEFLFGGQVVGRDTPPTHPVKNGTWHDVLTFPAQAIGEPLMLQAVVHTSAGTITLDWPVTVKR
jgi:hypothetical protein